LFASRERIEKNIIPLVKKGYQKHRPARPLREHIVMKIISIDVADGRICKSGVGPHPHQRCGFRVPVEGFKG
jgi:hypothetical protein